MLLTGRVIDGDEAFRIGFASAELEAGALAMAAQIAGMNPDGAKLVLAHLARLKDMSRDQALRCAQLSADWLDGKVGEKELKGKILGD